MKNERGITLIALIITVIVLIIITGIFIGNVSDNKDSVDKSKKEVALYELHEIEQAILERDTKYKQTNVDANLLGTKISWSDASNYLNAIVLKTSKPLNLLGLDYDKLGNQPANIYYYKLNADDLEKLGLHNVKENSEYIVNYSTGEVWDNVKLATKDNEPLYFGLKSNNLNEEYIKDGLIVWYDGINNTGNGHDNSSTTWKNLASNKYTGILGGGVTWNQDSLTFDGATGWVSLGELNLEEFTLEANIIYNNVTTDAMYIIGNSQNGGYALYKTGNVNTERK